jgi:hypothetical protein
MKKEKILLTFVGNNDPFSLHGDHFGPILSIIKKRKFDYIYLLFNSNKYWNRLNDTQAECLKIQPNLKIEFRMIDVMNPIDYNLVYPSMANVVQKIKQKHENGLFYISLTSGTPTMHSCWVLLSKNGIINAKLLQFSRENGLEDVKLNLDDFPEIDVSDIRIKLTELNRENEYLRKNLQIEKSLRNSFDLIGDGVDFDNEIVPAYYYGALYLTDGNKAKAARLLNIEPHTFRKRLKAIEQKRNDSYQIWKDKKNQDNS